MTDEKTIGDDVTADLRRLGIELLSDESLRTALRLVIGLATEAVPGSSGAGVSLMAADGTRISAASSDLRVEQADALQYLMDDGPCLEAWRNLRPVRADDLATEERWPSWTPGAASLGVRSVISTPLVAGTLTVGAIKVYAHHPRRFGAREERLLSMLAEQAAALLLDVHAQEELRRTNDQLREALRTRDMIGMAKGIVMAQGRLDERAAFAALVKASQRENVKLREVARRLVGSFSPDRAA